MIDKFPFPIEFIFNTPSHHRVHHGRNAQYLDKNYGGALIIFDRLFGTFEPEVEEPVYGVTHYLGTWNIFYLQTHQLYSFVSNDSWAEIWAAFRKTSSFWNKIRVFLDFGPGYNYFLLHPELVDNPPPPPTPETHQKYDSTLPNLPMTLYAFFHSVVVMLFATSLLSFVDKLDTNSIFIAGVFTLWGLYSMSCLFDQKRWAWISEALRLIFSSVYVTSYMTELSTLTIESLLVEPKVIVLGCVTILSLLVILLVPSTSAIKSKSA